MSALGRVAFSALRTCARVGIKGMGWTSGRAAGTCARVGIKQIGWTSGRAAGTTGTRPAPRPCQLTWSPDLRCAGATSPGRRPRWHVEDARMRMAVEAARLTLWRPVRGSAWMCPAKGPALGWPA
eukprot:251152-Chlamydomonas_euryale.AAC.7